MDLFGRAKQWVKGIGPADTSEPQPFRVICPEGHPIRGRRTEGYQALRCPECGEGVFVLPKSPLPLPPTPASRADRGPAAGMPIDDAPIPLADHVPDPRHEAEDVEWLEPVEPVEGVTSAFDPVEAAVSDLSGPQASPPAPARRSPAAARPAGAAGAAAPGQTPDRPAQDPPAARRPGPSAQAAPTRGQILVPYRPSLKDRLRRNRPLLVGLAVVGVLIGTVTWTLVRDQRRNAPALVQQGREEGIPALNRGEFDRAHRILSRASAAVEALRGQIGGADEIRQAAREAAIFVDLVPEPLESILDRRARTADEEEWQRIFDRSYKGRSILISANVVATPSDPAGRYELNYQILSVHTQAPLQGRIDFEGFRLFELGPPEAGWQIQFGARLAAVDPENVQGYRFRLEPNSGVTITHQDALRVLGWGPVEVASGVPGLAPGFPASPVLLTSLLAPAILQDLRNETPDRVRELLGAPQSFARSVSQGEYLEQWIYPGPGGSRQYLNFVQDAGRSGPLTVRREFFMR